VGGFSRGQGFYRRLTSDQPYDGESKGIQNFMPSRSHPGGSHPACGRKACGFFFCIMEAGDDEVAARRFDGFLLAGRPRKCWNGTGALTVQECVRWESICAARWNISTKSGSSSRTIKQTILFSGGRAQVRDMAWSRECSPNGRQGDEIGT